MYSHILIPVALDHEGHFDTSLEAARRLLADGGRLTLLNVVEDIPSYAQSYVPDGMMEQNAKAIDKAMSELSDSAGDDCNYAIEHGKPSAAILDYAEVNKADCIVIASHKPGLGDFFIGSTAARVVRHAKCNVHVLR
ncbi:MAG: universal stress protein [Pseudomonadota bacterium]